MFSLRCFKCGWPINLNRAELEAAVGEALESKDSHYALVCPNCRRTNKVSVKQMRRKLPRNWQPGAVEETEAAEESEAKKEDEAEAAG